MNKKLIFLIFCSLIICLSIVIYLLFFQVQKTEDTNKSTNQKEFSVSLDKKTDGQILDLSLENQTITILSSTDKLMTIALNAKTGIWDKEKKPTTSEFLKKGFTISINGQSSRTDLLIAQKIQITASPLIMIDYPKNNNQISKNFKIQGLTKLPENNQIYIRLTNSRNKQTYSNTRLNLSTRSEYQTFDFPISLEKAAGLKDQDILKLEIFQKTEKEKKENEKISLDLVFSAKN